MKTGYYTPYTISELSELLKTNDSDFKERVVFGLARTASVGPVSKELQECLLYLDDHYQEFYYPYLLNLPEYPSDDTRMKKIEDKLEPHPKTDNIIILIGKIICSIPIMLYNKKASQIKTRNFTLKILDGCSLLEKSYLGVNAHQLIKNFDNLPLLQERLKEIIPNMIRLYEPKPEFLPDVQKILTLIERDQIERQFSPIKTPAKKVSKL